MNTPMDTAGFICAPEIGPRIRIRQNTTIETAIASPVDMSKAYERNAVPKNS